MTAEATLLDRQNLVPAETRDAFAALNWSVETGAADVFCWREPLSPWVDVMLSNLFLHHFQREELRVLLHRAAVRTSLFIACEPRRSPRALVACRLLRLIGCNRVTWHDAAVSVRAGFVDRELSALWPAAPGWETSEKPAGVFSHCFVAKRND